MRASAFEEAVVDYQQALAIVRERGGDDPNLRFRLGAARSSAGQWEEAVADLKGCLESYRGAADSEGMERTSYSLTLLHAWRGEFPHAMLVMQEALTASPESRSEPRARLLALSGTMLALGGEVVLAEALIARAEEIAEERGDPALLGYVLTNRALRQGVCIEFEQELATLERADGLLRPAGDLFSLSQCINYRTPALGYLGRHDEMARQLDELSHLAGRLGDASSAAVHALMRGILALVQGRLSEARRCAEEAERGARGSAALVLPAAVHLSAEVGFLLGDEEDSEERAAEASRLHAEMGSPANRYEGPFSLLYYRACRGDGDGAQSLLDELPPLAAPGEPLTCAAFDGAVMAAAALAILDRGSEAALFYPAMLGLAERGVVFAGTTFPSLRRVLGMVAAANGWWEPADLHFRRALEQTERAGAFKETIETIDWTARMRLARNAAGDREEATALLLRAAAGYREMGMQGHAERADRLARSASRRHP
jgi:tetratricopeptide (TPR) repeat protein